jgi:hypothetical protein
VPREQKEEANDLAQNASRYRLGGMDTIVEIPDMEAEDWRKDILEYLRDLSQPTSRKVRNKALKYVVLDDTLYYRMIKGILLKCLNDEDAKLVMAEVHEGICRIHQSTYKMKWMLRRARYYWPMMLEDCFEYYKGCQDFLKFGAV